MQNTYASVKMILQQQHPFAVLLLIATFFIGTINATYAQQAKVNIVSYGAIAGTNINNAKAIQSAIDDVNAKGGGTVVVPAGKFTTGTITLKSGTTLHLEDGATLLGIADRMAYNGPIKPALIVARGQHNIAITGRGTIDGNADNLMEDIFARLKNGSLTDPNWQLTRPNENTRTNLLYAERCTDVTVKGVLFKDATSWVTHYEQCNGVNIDSITIESVAYWNNDGVDIVDCRNVRVTNSYINAADDAICLKSSDPNSACDSIYIANCILRSSANAIKFGTASVGGFSHVTIENITVFDTFRSALALEAVDGGFLEHVSARNIVATNTGNAILIRLAHRNKDDKQSRLRHIRISDMQVSIPKHKPDEGYRTEGPLLMYPPGFEPSPGVITSVSPWNYKEKSPNVKLYRHNVFPASIAGLPGHMVEDVVLENISVNYYTAADSAVNYFPIDSFNTITEAVSDYPEFSMFGELPVWGFYVRHADGIVFRNVQLQMAGKDFRPAILVNDVSNMRIDGLGIRGGNVMPALYLHQTPAMQMKNLQLGAPEKISLKVLGH